MSGEPVPTSAPPSHVVVRPAKVSGYDLDAFCPVCGHRVDETEGDHGIPRSVIDGEHLGIFESVDGVPVFGYRCNRHRVDHVLPAPASVSPDEYEAVTLDLEGGFEVGAPPDVVERGGP